MSLSRRLGAPGRAAWHGAIERLRDALVHPVLYPLLAAALAASYIATSGGRTAFGAPFLLTWAAFVAAFYAGWDGHAVAQRILVRREGTAKLVGAVLVVVLLALAGAAGWYLFTRRGLGGVERPVAMWAAAIVALAVVIGGAVRWRRPWVSAVRWLLPVQVVAAWIALRGYLLTTDFRLYDFEVYVAGGMHFLDGVQPYLTAPLARLPSAATEDVFLYPPPLLPVFGWISQIAEPLRSQAWIALTFMAAVAALRLIGVRWPWVAALVLFPPVLRGVEAGNVATLTFLVFAASAFVPALLPIGVLFKPQFAIPSLWLLRERRWHSIAASAAILALIFVVTLPLVGIGLWFDWAEGLTHREASQRAFPLLYGYSLAQYMPLPAFVVIALGAIAVPLFMRGERSLAGLGLATIVAAPSLWLHGFVFAFPALLALQAPLVWFALGIADGPWLWAIVVVGYLGLAFGRWDRREPIRDPTHPLVGTSGVWRGQGVGPTDRSPATPPR